MATDSKHKLRPYGIKRTLIVGSVSAGTGVVVVILLIESLGLPHISAVAASGIVTAVMTFVAIRLAIVPRLNRVHEALGKIESLVGSPASPDVPGEHRGRQARDVGELVDRLERTATRVESKLSRLSQVESYRQEFLGDVSHELQTPIFAVQGFAETLLHGALDDTSVNRDFVQKILRHSERLSTLVNDLSHISQIETGSLQMVREAFDPRGLLRDVQESTELLAESSEVELLTFVSTDVDRVVADRTRIRQVLENLISNGIKHNEPGGRVEVSVRSDVQDRVVFAVTDDGIGISQEHIERVTERFYRVDKSRSRQRGGTGLGLSIVKHILEAHHTKLKIYSRPGHGATFSFELPADRDESEASGQKHAHR